MPSPKRPRPAGSWRATALVSGSAPSTTSAAAPPRSASPPVATSPPRSLPSSPRPPRPSGPLTPAPDSSFRQTSATRTASTRAARRLPSPSHQGAPNNKSVGRGAEAIWAGAFGGVHRPVGGGDEFSGRADSLARRARDADADRDGDRFAFAGKRVPFD